MTRFTRRQTLQLAISLAASGVLASHRPAFAAPAYKFVRIAGLPEQGIAGQVLSAIYERAGIEVSITPMPGARALELAISGEVDGEAARIFSLGENAPSLIRMPTPVSSLKTVAFARSDADVTLNGREDLETYSSVIQIGVLHTMAITEGISSVTEVSDLAAMFRIVAAGRADIALTTPIDGEATLRSHGIEGLTLLDSVLNDQPLFHYVHESKRDVLDVIEPIAAEMAASGELAALRQQLETDYLASL